MTTITIAQDIEAARERLAPVFAELREDMGATFWESFGAAAARYRAARNEATAAREFAGIVREFERDTAGTLLNPAYRRKCATVPVRRESIPPMPSSEPWATMPTDGSGAMGRAERTVVFLTGVLSAVVLVWLGFLVTGMFGTSPDAPPAYIPAATAADVRETDMITRGAYWSWEAATECGRGNVSCDTALARINGEAARYGLHVWEDGSVSPLDN